MSSKAFLELKVFKAIEFPLTLRHKTLLFLRGNPRDYLPFLTP